MRALVKMECVMAVRTTVIGSWWPYPEDETDLARYHAGKLSATEGERFSSVPRRALLLSKGRSA
jgi:hypothetical protein